MHQQEYFQIHCHPAKVRVNSLLNENVRISIKISLKFVPKGPINKIPALVQIMIWRRPGDKPLSEPMMVRLLTHICVTRPQWVKASNWITFHKADILHEFLTKFKVSIVSGYIKELVGFSIYGNQTIHSFKSLLLNLFYTILGKVQALWSTQILKNTCTIAFFVNFMFLINPGMSKSNAMIWLNSNSIVNNLGKP